MIQILRFPFLRFPFTMSWLRVFRRAEASRMRPGVGQQLHTSAMRSEKCVRLRGNVWARMRVIAVFFCPRAPELLTWRMSYSSHYFNRLERLTKLATSSYEKLPSRASCYRSVTMSRKIVVQPRPMAQLCHKGRFVAQLWWEASLPEHLACHNGTLVAFLQIRTVSV